MVTSNAPRPGSQMHRSTAFVLLSSLLVPAVALAYGEGADGRPSVEERAIHYYTDEVRIDPDFYDDAFWEDWPVPPLVYNRDLNDAARFYAEDMEANPNCFPADHSSCDGTSFEDRVRSFYDGAMIGENIAMGYWDPEAAVWEAWMYSPGHHDNMLRGEWSEMGTGFAGTVNSASSWYVQDFGTRGALDIPEVTSATHSPLYPSTASSVEFLAAIYDTLDQPAHVQLQVGGLCHDMDMDREKDTGSDNPVDAWTFGATVQSGSEGCVQWLIAVTRVDGTRVTYPDTGSLILPVGGADCVPWTDQRAESECNPSAGSGLGGQGIGCGTDEGDPDVNVGADAQYGSCSIVRGPRRLGLLILLSLVGIARRRRRG